MKVKVLEWDSNFFNKKIGVIEIEEEIEILLDFEGLDLIYVKQIENEHFEAKGFKEAYADTKVVFSKSISKSNNLLKGFIFSAFDTDINREQIYKLAYESGKFSRFKLDNNFQKHEFEALYKRWVDNSFSKEYADAILVYKDNSAILGFITYKIFKDYATIGLIAVCVTHQGKGIGRALLKAVENELANTFVKELRIPTQLQNEHACGFYTKLGYNIIEKTIIKHYWRL
jgi:dTDP-4-amino-4,6-dideoxy-D-galactose acyltransferase